MSYIGVELVDLHGKASTSLLGRGMSSPRLSRRTYEHVLDLIKISFNQSKQRSI